MGHPDKASELFKKVEGSKQLAAAGGAPRGGAVGGADAYARISLANLHLHHTSVERFVRKVQRGGLGWGLGAVCVTVHGRGCTTNTLIVWRVLFYAQITYMNEYVDVVCATRCHSSNAPHTLHHAHTLHHPPTRSTARPHTPTPPHTG